MTKPRLAPPPPAPDAPAGGDSVERFIAAAPGKQGPRPWKHERVRDDVRITFSVRVPEPLGLKLEWLIEEGENSRNAVIIAALEAYVTAEFRRLGEPE